MIRWKVVTWPGRRSMFINDQKYGLRYRKGARVTARPKTLGCMVFKRRQDAMEFIKRVLDMSKCFKIIRVQGIGRGTVPKHIGFPFAMSLLTTELFLDTYYKTEGCVSIPAPAGTICYKQIKVLD